MKPLSKKKRCTICNKIKLRSEFYKNSKRYNKGYCKECQRELRSTSEYRDKKNDNSREWHKKDPRRLLLYNARRRAKDYNIPFSLTLDDIVIPEKCPILGIPLYKTEGKKTENSPSLDRVFPELGYIVGNVCVISSRANRMKNDATLEDIEKIAKYMRGYLK